MEAILTKLNPFASDLKGFFESCKTLPLFKKLPLREDIEERKQRLSDGRYLFRPCGVELNTNESNRIAIELLELLKKHLSDHKDELTSIA
jgi:hypothetical protein